MSKTPTITRIEIHEFEHELKDVGRDPDFALGPFYEPGKVSKRKAVALRVHTDIGVQGEYVSIAPATVEQIRMFADYLLGKNALERERFYGDIKAILRKNDKMGLGPVDIALWDLAGKYHNAPIYVLLGGYRTKFPAYASTYHSDRTKGGLNSPEAFADFAEQCLEMGYKGFKIHSWGNGPIEQEIAVVHSVGQRVGGKMDVMIDPCCAYNTFADALRVGQACDEENYFWYEDPLKDGGVSHFAHRKLKQLIKTPLLQGEHVHLVETHMDMSLAEATDFVRADPEYDGGITGVMKIAHAAEGIGMDVELHIAGPAQRQCMAAMRNSNYYEMGLVHPKVPNMMPPVYKNGYKDELDSIDRSGCVEVPQGPGLGVEYDWEFIQKHRVGGADFRLG
jgi:L-alanine-DL-glutamate epimerase-like enolase superfamily enzyme